MTYGFLSSLSLTLAYLWDVLISSTFLPLLGQWDTRLCVSAKAKIEEKQTRSLVVRKAGGSSGLFFLAVPNIYGIKILP